MLGATTDWLTHGGRGVFVLTFEHDRAETGLGRFPPRFVSVVKILSHPGRGIPQCYAEATGLVTVTQTCL